MRRDLLLVGTPKGAFILETDESHRDWALRGPLCDGWPIHDLVVEPRSGALLAAGGSPWYGPAVWRSDDLGATWTHSSEGLTYGDGDGVEPIKTVWSLASTPDGAILAGVEPAGLFRSEDGGATWAHVEGLTDHPTRSGWQPGAGGLILHTIVPHPDRRAADVGRDLGRRGIRDARWRRQLGAAQPRRTRRLLPGSASRRPGSASTSWRRLRAGPRRSTSRTTAACTAARMAGEQWTDLTRRLARASSGSRCVTHPRDPKTFWIIPLNGDDRGPLRPRRQRRGVAHARRRRHLAARRRRPAPAGRVPERAARSDGPRHARSGRDHVRDQDRAALAQSRRGRRPGSGSPPTCPRSGRSRRSTSAAD